MGKLIVCLHTFLVLLYQRSQITAFNLDIIKPLVYSGPPDSYFGYSVDFFKPDDQLNLLVGAPKSNTSSSAAVVERGAVYSCSWQSVKCQQIDFDNTNDRNISSGVEFKSHQWFGATVRSDGEHILACAPLYRWSTPRFTDHETVGTCYLKKGGKIVEYSPCRTNYGRPDGQGFCQAGFSADFVKKEKSRVVVGGPGSFYWQGQLISDDISEVLTRVNNQFITPYANQLSTVAATPHFDDSYLGYSLSVGDFNNDGRDDYLTGVPRGEKVVGYVTIFNGRNMESMINFTGTQMAAYFGYAVAAVDINNDGHLDVFAGAPLFMSRASGKRTELGQVSVFLGITEFTFQEPVHLNGLDAYGRFGNAISSLGDLDQDGYNDIAISSPYGGADGKGVVYVYNGRATGISPVASQVLQGQWASTSTLSPSFGFSLQGATDIDKNGYPDLIVGAFGADKAVLYRARPVIITNLTLDIIPQVLNLEDKTCTPPGTTTAVTCFKVNYCLQARAKGAAVPISFKMQVNVQLDRLKLKGAKRAQFVISKDSQQTVNLAVPNTNKLTCGELDAFVIADSEFRDKITPISVFLDYQIDYDSAADPTGLLPVLNQLSPGNASRQAHILLNCGSDNICKPDLQLRVKSDRQQMYIGEECTLTLDVLAQNIGEGAYEAELHVYMPPEAHFSRTVQPEGQPRLSCAYRRENQTREVVCDLGNPMKNGTSLSTKLEFTVYTLSDENTEVKFGLQIHSSNEFSGSSVLVSTTTKLAVLAEMNMHSISAPEQIILPIANWKPKSPPDTVNDLGPLVHHTYELHNNGPSVISEATMVIQWPQTFNNDTLLYITSYDLDGPIQCHTNTPVNPLNLTSPDVLTNDTDRGGRGESHIRTRRDVGNRDSTKEAASNRLILDCNKASCSEIKCKVGRLERQKRAIVYIKSHLVVSTFLKTENQNQSYTVVSSASFMVTKMPYKNMQITLPANSTTVSTNVDSVVAGQVLPTPSWVIIVAVLAGLLLLALLIFIMYKCGFFKRSRPPQEDHEKEQLQPNEGGETNPEG